jgi:hypothetical protein
LSFALDGNADEQKAIRKTLGKLSADDTAKVYLDRCCLLGDKGTNTLMKTTYKNGTTLGTKLALCIAEPHGAKLDLQVLQVGVQHGLYSSLTILKVNDLSLAALVNLAKECVGQKWSIQIGLDAAQTRWKNRVLILDCSCSDGNQLTGKLLVENGIEGKIDEMELVHDRKEISDRKKNPDLVDLNASLVEKITQRVISPCPRLSTFDLKNARVPHTLLRPFAEMILKAMENGKKVKVGVHNLGTDGMEDECFVLDNVKLQKADYQWEEDCMDLDRLQELFRDLEFKPKVSTFGGERAREQQWLFALGTSHNNHCVKSQEGHKLEALIGPKDDTLIEEGAEAVDLWSEERLNVQLCDGCRLQLEYFCNNNQCRKSFCPVCDGDGDAPKSKRCEKCNSPECLIVHISKLGNQREDNASERGEVPAPAFPTGSIGPTGFSFGNRSSSGLTFGSGTSSGLTFGNGSSSGCNLPSFSENAGGSDGTKSTTSRNGNESAGFKFPGFSGKLTFADSNEKQPSVTGFAAPGIQVGAEASEALRSGSGGGNENQPPISGTDSSGFSGVDNHPSGLNSSGSGDKNQPPTESSGFGSGIPVGGSGNQHPTIGTFDGVQGGTVAGTPAPTLFGAPSPFLNAGKEDAARRASETLSDGGSNKEQKGRPKKPVSRKPRQKITHEPKRQLPGRSGRGVNPKYDDFDM